MGKNLRDDKTARGQIYSVCRKEIALKPVLVLVSVGFSISCVKVLGRALDAAC
jgi:hypothetical protein